MTDSGRARLGLWVGVMLCANVARAGEWGIDPSVGVSGDYASNPLLVTLPRSEETDAALLFDSPVSYHGDALVLSFLPSFRLSDARSYDSVNSDFVHLNASGEFDTERNKLSLTAGATRDSSLYENYLVDGTAAVRRDGLNGGLAWTYHLSERLDTDLDVDTAHVRYGMSTGSASLVSYTYSTVAPDLSWQRTELDRVTLSANAGQYDSLDGTTRSRNYGGNLAYKRSLSEIWSLNLTAGYTRQQNRLDLEVPVIVFTGSGFEIVDIPVRVESQISSPVYSANLTRTGLRWTLSASATRQEVPTGFAFLSRQTTYDLQLSYAVSPLWTASLHEYWLKAHDPSLQGTYIDRTVNATTLDFSHQVTEHYTVDCTLSRVDETYAANGVHVLNNQITLTLSYKFNHISLQ